MRREQVGPLSSGPAQEAFGWRGSKRVDFEECLQKRADIRTERFTAKVG